MPGKVPSVRVFLRKPFLSLKKKLLSSYYNTLQISVCIYNKFHQLDMPSSTLVNLCINMEVCKEFEFHCDILNNI